MPLKWKFTDQQFKDLPIVDGHRRCPSNEDLLLTVNNCIKVRL
jgi:hypothetical protein